MSQRLCTPRGRTGGWRSRRGFSLVELLVVISIIGVLVAILLPALNAAREMSRKATCQSNLRQIYVGMQTHAERHGGALCSGGFDWQRDGCVTEIGWVADLVNQQIPVGKLLCPANPAQISSAYEDLLAGTVTQACTTVKIAGSEATTNPDGTENINPCRAMLDGGSATDQTKKIFERHYNTNYCASWFLCRTGPILDDDGHLKPSSVACTADLLQRSGTIGPLSRARVDAAATSAAFIPLLGDGNSVGTLSAELGDAHVGSPLAARMTRGPRVNSTMAAYVATGPKEGATGWWAGWMDTIQDYRGFGPVHGGYANVLFGDGSVRGFYDQNRDGYLNNGFDATGDSGNGFQPGEVEMPQTEIHSRYSVTAPNRL